MFYWRGLENRFLVKNVQLLEDLGNLHEIVRQQRERCETLSFQSLLAEDQQTNGQALTSVKINRNGVGRPTLDVSQELLETLHFQVGFSWPSNS